MKRPWAWPLAPLYGAGVWGKHALWRVGLLKHKRLAWPVVSVGSLSAGGAGKTPVVMMLAELLTQQGMAVDVLTRGYGRQSKAIERVESNGDASRFGDEPMEMAQAGLEVYVGADRYTAGRLAESRGGRGVHVLDDGFQHRQLWRNLDVVLVTLADIRDELLPAGDLREPLKSLMRTDVVVLREEEEREIGSLLEGTGALERPCWTVRRRLRLPKEVASRPLVFCGIARPEGFLAMLREVGCVIVATSLFSDHHWYDSGDIEGLVGKARAAGANGFVVTAKDAVKLSAEMMARLAAVGPVVVAELRVSLVDEAAAVQLLQPIIDTVKAVD